jgi:hypothetical protein
MNVTDWNSIADAYFDIDDPEGRAVLTFIREKLATLQSKRLLGNGGDDGKFAVVSQRINSVCGSSMLPGLPSRARPSDSSVAARALNKNR